MLARTGVGKISSVTCGFSPFKIHFTDYPKTLISRIKYRSVYIFSIKYRYSDILLKNHKVHLKPFVLLQSDLLCVDMVSVTSASRYLASVSSYQSRSTMYIRGLILWNSMELAEAVPIARARVFSKVALAAYFCLTKY